MKKEENSSNMFWSQRGDHWALIGESKNLIWKRKEATRLWTLKYNEIADEWRACPNILVGHYREKIMRSVADKLEELNNEETRE